MKTPSERQQMKLRYRIFFTLILIAVIATCAVYNYTKTAIQAEKSAYPLEYTHIVEKYADQYGIDCAIIYATILIESGFNPNAASPKGAQGLMQITPDTFEWLCTKTGEDNTKLDILDPDVNIRYGTYFLAMLYEEFGDAKIAHAAYNAGRARIRNWLKDENYFKDGELYYIPFTETRNYVEKIKKATEKYRNILEVTKK